jgi:hypothetical protein
MIAVGNEVKLTRHTVKDLLDGSHGNNTHGDSLREYSENGDKTFYGIHMAVKLTAKASRNSVNPTLPTEIGLLRGSDGRKTHGDCHREYSESLTHTRYAFKGVLLAEKLREIVSGNAVKPT